jgi:RNA processing factor Prp31
MNRVARRATEFVWNIETIVVAVVPPVDALVGLSSIWIAASSLASIVRPPSSAIAMLGACTSTSRLPSPVTGEPTCIEDSDTMSG